MKALALAGMATLAFLLASCGVAPTKEPPVQGAPTKPPRSGKYYLDDGPPEALPGNLAEVPDALVRDEPFHRFANRPYTVFGKTYVPVVNREPTKERGMASWYGRKFHGQKTASGEIYDMFAMTAAHKTFPIPSYARVTNPKNGKSVVVRINDRGPFMGNRIIDLSYAAALKLDLVTVGSGLVEVERLVAGVPESSATASAGEPPRPAVVETPVVAQEPSGLWLQIGAFTSLEAAEIFRARVARDMAWLNEPVQIASHDGMHRVRLGPYRNNEEATAIGEKVHRSLGVAPVLIQR